MKPTFANLIAATATSANTTQVHARRVLEDFFRHLSDAVWAAGRVNVPGLAAFRVRVRKKRKISNPKTREPMTLPSTRSVSARVAKPWRRRG